LRELADHRLLGLAEIEVGEGGRTGFPPRSIRATVRERMISGWLRLRLPFGDAEPPEGTV
jgi:hypothetical protein